MFEYLVFFFFAAVAVVFATVVIIHRNPVISALSLVMTFFSLAVMYVLLDAPFIAALQVLIYAGAIMVLFLFVIMLLNLSKQPEPRTRPIQQFFAWVGGSWFGFVLIYYLVKAAFLRSGTAPFDSSPRQVGYELFEVYLLPFEMVSILLLAAIVGAIVLTQKMGKPPAERELEPSVDEQIEQEVA
ncbi:MAG: NADH-quinone oxidoreductase subunit J [Thermoanaerobaculia bacterium]|nr:NADH-quinone oxidoreductase subunit J [Thermoanaerobaculia bacterium]